MGCWNETCAVSNLPITDGDSVVQLFICPMAYSNHKYYIRTLPIFGEYDNYGGIEPEPGQEKLVELIINQFKFDGIGEVNFESINDIINSWHDNFRFDLNCLNRIVTAEMEKRAKKLGHDYKVNPKDIEVRPTEINSIFILRDVWDMLLAVNVGDWNDKDGKLHSYVNYRLAAKEYISTLIKEKEDITPLDVDVPADTLELYKKLAKLTSEISNLKRNTIKIENIFSKSYSAFSYDVLAAPFQLTNAHLLELIEESFVHPTEDIKVFDVILNLKDLEECVERLAQLAKVSWNLRSTRRQLQPTGSKGSQEQEYENHVKIHVNLAKIACQKRLDMITKIIDWGDSPNDHVAETEYLEKILTFF